jgi:hypothetical protein
LRAEPARRLLALALLLLLASPASAALPLVGQLTATGARLEGSGSGPLVGALFLDHGQAHPALNGTAQQVAVRVESQTQSGRVDRNGGVRSNHDPVVDTRNDARIATAWADGDHEAYLFPLPGAPAPTVTLPGPCTDLAPAAAKHLATNPYASTPTAPDPTAEAAGALRPVPCAGATRLVVEGAFLVVLWGAEATVQDARGTTQAWSGARPEPGNPGVPPYLHNDRVQEIYLEVRGGRVELAWGEPASREVYVAGFQSDAAALTLAGAAGTLTVGGQAQAVKAGRLDLHGALLTSFGRTGDGLVVEVRGTPTAATLDGRALALVVAGQPRGFGWGLLLLVAGSVAVPAVGGVASHRAWSRRSLAALETLLAARRLEAVVRRSRTLARWSPFRTEALLLRIEAQVRQGQPGPAFEALQELPAAVRAGPLGAFLRGHILVAAGEDRAAAAHLAQAAARGPEFRSRIAADPQYAAARQDPALAAALGGRA